MMRRSNGWNKATHLLYWRVLWGTDDEIKIDIRLYHHNAVWFGTDEIQIFSRGLHALNLLEV